ncbi:unnamed protein product [Cylicocyclus nassatus]|uniref:Adenosine deaminase domain-containing protein n=1 Tax=Cylicocyclus nassatus TaxID=53992 RepID=A0AA36H769_CYLNA|nr:unnamed protein product [Cylicocyclus nassatus]
MPQMVTESECRRLLKVELHAHLNGSMSLKTIKKLYRMQKESSLNPASLEADLKLKQPSTMEEVFKIFPLIQSLTTTKQSVKIATIDVISEFAEDGVIYLELRSTPKMTSEMSKKEYVEAILEGIAESSRSLGIITRLILSVDRRQSPEEAEQTIALAVNDKTGLIVGIELSGNPAIDGRKFLSALKAARKQGLKITVHLAEVSNQLEEVEEFLHFKPDRIGHGTFLHTRDEYVNLMMHYRIPLEVCLTSNVLSMTTTSMANSHLKFWCGKSIPICLCTDDKGLMDCDLSSEFYKASQIFGFEMQDLWTISVNALKMSFLDKKSEDYRNLMSTLDRTTL